MWTLEHFKQHFLSTELNSAEEQIFLFKFAYNRLERIILRRLQVDFQLPCSDKASIRVHLTLLASRITAYEVRGNHSVYVVSIFVSSSLVVAPLSITTMCRPDKYIFLIPPWVIPVLRASSAWLLAFTHSLSGVRFSSLLNFQSSCNQVQIYCTSGIHYGATILYRRYLLIPAVLLRIP